MLSERRDSSLSRALRVVASSALCLLIASGLGCASSKGTGPARGGAWPAAEPSLPDLPSAAAASDEPYLLLNQKFIEGARHRALDLTDVDAVFGHVFSSLPERVVVYPSENYYYFILVVQGRQVWGNIRLPAGEREHGKLSFGYFEFVEFPQLKGPRTGLSRSKFYGPEDGLGLVETEPFLWRATYRDRTVEFQLHRLSQEPPTLFRLGADEVFVERTFDESGYQFFLLFNSARNYFFWVLNEEPGVPDVLVPDSATRELVIGQRSGFAFWVDSEHEGRKVLVAIRRLNSNRNDYYDGPFDQLADNYADETRVAEYMQKAAPGLAGRIDKYGYYTDQERPMRVALACYYSYLAPSDLRKFFEQAGKSEDPYQYISRRGIPTYPKSEEGAIVPDPAEGQEAPEGAPEGAAEGTGGSG